MESVAGCPVDLNAPRSQFGTRALLYRVAPALALVTPFSSENPIAYTGEGARNPGRRGACGKREAVAAVGEDVFKNRISAECSERHGIIVAAP